MAWEGSTRRTTLPPDWPARRQAVLERDGHQCTEVIAGQRCVAPATDVDHVGHRDDHQLDNLRSLCGPHHDHKSGRQGGQARAAKYDRRRPQQPHPGLR